MHPGWHVLNLLDCPTLTTQGACQIAGFFAAKTGWDEHPEKTGQHPDHQCVIVVAIVIVRVTFICVVLCFFLVLAVADIVAVISFFVLIVSCFGYTTFKQMMI